VYFAIEQPLLMPLPQEPFETGRLFTPRVDRYSQIAVRTNRYSVPTRLIGKRVRVVLHASHLMVYDRNAEVARHERLIAKGSCRLDLDHYLEALIRKPGACHKATCDQRVKDAAGTPGAQYAACASSLEPAVELNSDEQTVLSRLEAPADTSAAESAVLAAEPGAAQAGSEATPQTTEEDAPPSNAPADEPDTAAAAARPRPWKEPKWCIDASVDNTWYIERMRGCGIWRSEVNAIDVRTGRKVGGIKYLVIGYSFSARDSKTWAYQVRLLESSRWGRAVNGTKASGNASCVGKCKVVIKSLPAQTSSTSAEPYGQFFMDTTINTTAAKQRGTGRSVASWTFTNPQWVAPSEPTKHSTVDVCRPCR
jgi:hypothetical protein